MSDVPALPSAGYADRRTRAAGQGFLGLPPVVWARMAIVAALMTALFWPNLRRLWYKTNPFFGEANWAHAFFVPLIGLYYLYINREALLSPESAPALSPARKAWGAWLELQAVIWGIGALVWAYNPLVLESAALRMGAAAMLLASGLLVPLKTGIFAGFRALLVRLAEHSAGWFGTYVMLWGLFFYAWSIWPGQNSLCMDYGMIATLFGVVLLLCGWGVMRLAWFPIVFLVCAIPLPPVLYSELALPLQYLAATAAVWVLRATGVEALQEGTKLFIGGRVLNVAEACAGLKSLMTFVSVGAAVAFLSSRSLWQKLIISLSAIPIAIFCNMIRVAGQGLLDHYWDPRLSESFAHQFVGMIMLIPAFFLILLVAWILDNLFIEETDKRKVDATRKTPPVTEAPRSASAQPQTQPAPAQDMAAAARRLAAARSSRPASSAAETK